MSEKQDAAAQHVYDAFGGAEIARRIRASRARAGFTRRQLSAASGASERYLALLEAGEGNPSVEMLMNIAQALDIPLAELLPLGGERDSKVAHAAQMLRRLSPEQLGEAVNWLSSRRNLLGEKGRRIVLVGLRGAGKTSLGTALAERFQVPFFEISKEVERLYGGSIGTLLEMNGPATLHRYEAEVLEAICAQHIDAIVAAPGAIVSNGNLYDQLLRSAWTIWLQATPEDHMERVVSQGDLRPITGRSAMEDLKSILAARSVDYGRADAALNTSGQSFQETLDLLEETVAGIML